MKEKAVVSILILLDYLFLYAGKCWRITNLDSEGLNPYFTGLSILMISSIVRHFSFEGLNPYFTGLSILMSR